MSHLGLIWLLSVSKTTRVFTGLVGTSAANKRKKEVVYPSLAWKSCQNRCLGKMLWDLIHIFLFTSGRDKLRPRGHDVASRARSLWAMSARVIQTVSEWARMWGWSRERARLSLREPDWVRESKSWPERGHSYKSIKRLRQSCHETFKTVLFSQKCCLSAGSRKRWEIIVWSSSHYILYIRSLSWIRKKLFQPFSQRHLIKLFALYNVFHAIIFEKQPLRL